MNNKQKIFVSSCLLGEPVRYDGSSSLIELQIIEQWKKEHRLVSACPELLGGLATPRPQAEVQSLIGSDRVHVLTDEGGDVSEYFLLGAQKVLAIAQKSNCKYALMMARSPSCGNELVYNGKFNGELIEGAGVTARLLIAHGIKVFNQFQIKELSRVLVDG